MELIVKFLAKSTVWVRAFVYDKGGALTDPTTVKLILADAKGVKVVNDLAMTRASTGIYDYYYTIPANAAEGWWNGEVWTQDGTGASAKYSSAEFSIEVRRGL